MTTEQPKKMDFVLKLSHFYLGLIMFLFAQCVFLFFFGTVYLITFLIILCVLLYILYHFNKEIDATLLIIYEK